MESNPESPSTPAFPAMPAINITIHNKNSTCKKVTKFICYFLLFCIGFFIAKFGLIAIYAVLKRQDVSGILPEECFISSSSKYPLPLPIPSANDRYFDFNFRRIAVDKTNRKFEYHSNLRKAAFKIEPLKVFAAFFVAGNLFSVAVYVFHCCKKGFWGLTCFWLGFQTYVTFVFVFLIVKSRDSKSCDDLFWQL